MATLTAHQIKPSSLCTVSNLTTTSDGAMKVECINNDQFPAGLRVLVVDDDPICLLILDRLLRQCQYEVTTCGKATTALKMLREGRDKFDVVISDVVMPDMDGFKLLELVGLEMDLPVIMMSTNGETSAVMKGITHGACDYLLKPVRIEELRNIWQHVVRKRQRESELSPAAHEEKHRRGIQDGDHNSSGNDYLDGTWRLTKKRKDIKEEEEDAEQDNDDPSSTKKPRVVWSVDLHQQFVRAVDQLGIEKAVPKRILELMNVQGLTRENVASHLQKYRLYLKRISGVAHQPGGLGSSFAGTLDSHFNAVNGARLGGLGELQTLAATGQLSSQALVSTLQTGLLGRLGTSNSLGISGVEQPSLLWQLAAMQGASNGVVRQPYGQSLLTDGSGSLHQALSSGPDLKQLAQGTQQVASFGQVGAPMEKAQTGISALQQQFSAVSGLGGIAQLPGVSNSAPVNSHSNALAMQMLQQQAGAQLINAGVINSPSGGLLGQHLLSNDNGGVRAAPSLTTTIGPSVNIGNGVGASAVGQARPGHGSTLGAASSSSPSTLSVLGRPLSSDTKAFHSLGTGNVNISSLTPPEFNSEFVAPGMKTLESAFVEVTDCMPSSARRMDSDMHILMGLNYGATVNLSISNSQGWQELNLVQEGGQLPSVPSPRFSQPVSGGQALNMNSGQEQSQRQSAGFTGQNMKFSGKLVTESSRLRPSLNIIETHTEHLMADSELKGQDAALGLIVEAKRENTFLPEPFSSSDELLQLFLKQQRGGLGVVEANLVADSYSAMDDMPVNK